MDRVNNTAYDFQDGLANAWANTAAFLPKLVAFLLILAIGYFIAMALGKVVDKILHRVGFDRAVEKSGMKKALANTGFHPSDVLGKVVFYGLLLFVLELAFGVFGPNPISDLLNRMIAFLPNIIVAIVITVIAASIAAGVREIVRGLLGGLSYGRLLSDLAAGGIIVLGVFAALNQLHIAPEIVNGLFYAMLAIVVGVSIVAIGGAGIQPMRTRWESALNRLEQEMPRVKQEVQSSASAANADAASMPVVPPAATNEGYLG